jgi:hypothetical protein
MVMGCCYFCLELGDVLMRNNANIEFLGNGGLVKEGEIVLGPDQIFLLNVGYLRKRGLQETNSVLVWLLLLPRLNR